MKRVVRALNRSGISYMITGALAASYYGRPRTTLDVDVVVLIRKERLRRLAEALKNAGLKTNVQQLEEAWESKYRIARAEDKRSPHTLDVILNDRRLERRRGYVLGLPTFYQSPESLVLAKLRMVKVTQHPERAAIDKEDIKAVIKSTRLNLMMLRGKARSQTTLHVLESLLSD